MTTTLCGSLMTRYYAQIDKPVRCCVTTTKKKVNSRLTNPKLEKYELQNIQYVTGLHIGSTGISWALLNQSENHLLNWKNYSFPSNVQKLPINDLASLIFDVKHSLPKSDIYVTESLNPIVRTSNPVQHGIFEFILQIQSMLCVAINCPGINTPETSHPKLVFLKNKLTGKIFNLLIKSECVTSRQIIENWIQQQAYGDQNKLEEDLDSKDEQAARELGSRVIFNEQCITNYDNAFGYSKESMGISLLYANCFSELLIREKKSYINRLLRNSDKSNN